MKRNVRQKSGAVVCLLLAAFGIGAGCKREIGGETVATPPRELAEKSLRQGNAPIAPPGTSQK